MSNLQVLADSFYDAFYSNSWRNSSTSLLGLSIQDSYWIQNIVCQKRVEAGEDVIGYKVGCTSIAIRDQFGIEEPISGRLFSPHIYSEGTQINRQRYANCAIEPEIVLTIGSDLFGQNLPDETLIKAIECVSPGIELHNYTFWHDPPCLQELICSGGIHAGLIVGDKKVSPRDLSFKNDIFSVYQDDKIDCICTCFGNYGRASQLITLVGKFSFVLWRDFKRRIFGNSGLSNRTDQRES